MAGKGSDAKADKLALTVAKGASLAASARAVGVPESTARRWAADPTFKPKVDELRGQMISRAVGKLAGVATKAAKKLGDLIDSRDENTALRAARAVLSDLIDIQSHAELAERLTELEKRADAGKKPGWHNN